MGHTHEDIDQMFSRFAVALRYNDAPSRIALTKVIIAGFSHLTEDNVHHLETVGNVSHYLRDIKQLNTFNGISFKRQFRIFLEQGHPVVSSRQTASGEEDFFAISGYALYTPIFKSGLALLQLPESRVQTEEKKDDVSWRPSSMCAKRRHSDIDCDSIAAPERQSSDSDSTESSEDPDLDIGEVLNVQQLKDQLCFYLPEVQTAFDSPQWRVPNTPGDKKHHAQLIKSYRRRVAAVDDFWGLSDDDMVDLDQLIGLMENPGADEDELKLDHATWGHPFLGESDGSGSLPIPGAKSTPEDSDDSDSSSSSGSDSADSKSNESVSVVDAPELGVGQFILARPADDEEDPEPFWIGQVVPDAQYGADSKYVRIHWYQRRGYAKDKRPIYKQCFQEKITEKRGSSKLAKKR